MTPHRTTKLMRRAAVVAPALALLTAGCTPGAETGAEDEGETAVDTDIEGLGDVTLTVWDQEVRGGQEEQIERLNEEFEETYPNITIDRVARSADDLSDTARLALTDDAPDAIQISNGRPDMGAFVEADLLRDLDPYAEAYGWRDHMASSVLETVSYSEDGVTFGEGSIYGLPQMGEMVGVFYNQELLDDLDLDAPETWDDFDTALAEADDADEIPIQFGNVDQWPGIHEFGALQTRFVDPETIRDLGYGQPGSSWTSEDNEEAAQMLVDWVEEDYFTPDFNGVDYDQAWQDFATGDGLFLIAGTWVLADIAAEMDDGAGVGFTALPGADSDDPVATGATGLPFTIPTNAENPDAAAAYIDFITSEDAMGVLAETGNLPVTDTAEQEAQNELQQEAFDTFGALTEADNLVPYLDWATVDFHDTIAEGVQDLTAEQSTPEEFLQDLETDYVEHVED